MGTQFVVVVAVGVSHIVSGRSVVVLGVRVCRCLRGGGSVVVVV
jgi:hypothetical protein